MPQTNLIKVLALESIHPWGYEILRNHNLILDEKLALTLEEIYKLVKDYDVLIIKSITKINSDLLKNAKNLKVIARAGAGLDNIDLNLCKDRNIKLIHTPDLNSNAAADFTVMQILNLVRKSFQAQDMVKNKDFIRDKLLGRDMSELTIGDKVDIIKEKFPEAKFFDGYDDCIIGMLNHSDLEPCILYSEEKIINKIMENSDGMTREEAQEYHDSNLRFSGGSNSPGFCQEIEDWDIENVINID